MSGIVGDFFVGDSQVVDNRLLTMTSLYLNGHLQEKKQLRIYALLQLVDDRICIVYIHTLHDITSHHIPLHCIAFHYIT